MPILLPSKSCEIIVIQLIFTIIADSRSSSSNSTNSSCINRKKDNEIKQVRIYYGSGSVDTRWTASGQPAGGRGDRYITIT